MARVVVDVFKALKEFILDKEVNSLSKFIIDLTKNGFHLSVCLTGKYKENLSCH